MQWSSPLPSRSRKKPSGVRSPVRNSRSRSSTSEVISRALSASVRATRMVGTPQTSAARRAASRLRIAAWVGISTLPPKMAALLFGSELVLEMDPGDPRLDIGLHDLEAVQRPAEAGLGVGHDRREPVALRAALLMLDLVGALQRAVDLPRQLGPGVGGIERLVGIHRAGGVGVGGGLPARQIDRLQARREPSASPGCRSPRPARAPARPASAIPTAAARRAAPGVCSTGNRAAQAEHVVRRCTAARFRRNGRWGAGTTWSKLVMARSFGRECLMVAMQHAERPDTHRQKASLCQNLTCDCWAKLTESRSCPRASCSSATACAACAAIATCRKPTWPRASASAPAISTISSATSGR